MEIQRVSSGVEFIYWWNLYNDKSQIILPWLILATASCMLVRYLYVSAVKDMNHDKESFYQVEFYDSA